MKKVISVLMALILGLTFAACSQPSAPAAAQQSVPANPVPAAAPAVPEAPAAAQESAAPEAPVELTYWYSWTDKIQENNENLTRMFNETVGKDKGIKVTAEYQGSYDELHQKLQAAYVAGETPAVTVMEIASIRTFAENGVLEPLSPYIARDGIPMDDFFAGLLGNCDVDGTWYGLPYLRSTPILYMNTTLLEQAGLDAKGPDTWEEFAEYCRVIKEKTGAYGLTQYSYIWMLEAMLLSNGTSALTPDELKCNINTPEAKEVLSFFKNLTEQGLIRSVAGVDSSRVKADAMNQECAMWFSSTADLTANLAVAGENGFEINTCFIPAFTKHGVPTGGCNLIISSKLSEAEKEAAWQFIKWMTDTEQAAYAHAFTGYVPSRMSAAKTEQIAALYEKTPQFKVALDQLNQYSTGRPMNPGYAEVSKELVGVMDAVWVNGADVESTVSAIEAKLNNLLAR